MTELPRKTTPPPTLCPHCGQVVENGALLESLAGQFAPSRDEKGRAWFSGRCGGCKGALRVSEEEVAHALVEARVQDVLDGVTAALRGPSKLH
jgi:hypothetical protein